MSVAEVPTVESYESFLERKRHLSSASGFEPLWLPDPLFPFQREMTAWAIRQGRAALFEDCGLGKGIQALTWGENVHRHTGRPVLVLAPLAVTFQLEIEAAKFGIDAATSRDGSAPAPITITNYDRLEKFDRTRFAGVVCDESSCLKSYSSIRKDLIIDFIRKMPYRLLCTATAAPNDYMELGNSSEALGLLGYQDVLSRFFVNKDKTSDTKVAWRRQSGRSGVEGKGWRFKGHAEEPFWRWVASWARALRKPSDVGFEDGDFSLPPLHERTHLVDARSTAPGRLFDVTAIGLREERDEARRTLYERCEMAANLLRDAERGVAWCFLNDEGDLLERLIPDCVQVAGHESIEAKEEKLLAFIRGEARVLVTKPLVAAWGLNLQFCHRMTFFPSHSFEQKYQAIRRCWRFGQRETVTVDIVTTEGGLHALANVERKAKQADRMFDRLVHHMRDALHIDHSSYTPSPIEVPAWL